MITWIPVKQRVPDDRRNVLTWGTARWGPFESKTGGVFLGSSKCNLTRTGSRFDNENDGRFIQRSVTHWAEITGPE